MKCDLPITGLINNRIKRSIITSLKAGKIEHGLAVLAFGRPMKIGKGVIENLRITH